MDFAKLRAKMVESQLRPRSISDARVLRAMGRVPREAFVPPELRESAYDDSPLPIGNGQTISQPYVVAEMVQALELRESSRVLEIGTGSGYAAAVLGEICASVYTIERIPSLAESATHRLASLGYDHARVICADGTLGWPEGAPYDAILVSAGGPSVPRALLAQLADNGRLVIPVGKDLSTQELIRVRRASLGEYTREDLGRVTFVPLVGAQGWSSASTEQQLSTHSVRTEAPSLSALVRECCEPIGSIDNVDLSPLLDRIGDARLVLLGEATHGTSEFYRMRARITQELVTRRGFNFVAIEGDWPDAARVDHYVRQVDDKPPKHPIFDRFPTWMWRNREVGELIEWLRVHNDVVGGRTGQVAVHGLDIYSMFASIERVVSYLDEVDPAAGAAARERYGCLLPWASDPTAYGRAATSAVHRRCEEHVVEILREMLNKRLAYSHRDGERFFDAAQNARLVASAERYYRAMYEGGAESWNLRDQHMFETLQRLLDHHGAGSKAIVWAHNSHLGDASATEMNARGEFNLGQLCRRAYGAGAYLVGFGTDHGTVAAATNWGDEMQIKRVRPSHSSSYERVCHDSGVPAFLLALRSPRRSDLREELARPRLERAIGVIYRPDTELQSHYFEAILPLQFDEYVWFDETHAVDALATRASDRDVADTYPFGI